ncbi:MAG: glycosyltransferase family 39 protein [Terracidiphilus sp.]
MNTVVASRRHAFLCTFLLLLCALATFPVAESGINDDWSFVQSARILAQTGHIVYNGWAATMLGWQLYLGALFAKLFGPSFTSIRASTLLVAMITAFLIQRTLVRAGISPRNATIGTFVIVLSPLFLPLAVSFMSDIDGLFCLVVCLYACLRALQAESNRAVLCWLAFAALSNAVGGTVRQIAWLGVLVMFPCVIWLLRRRPHVLALGALLYATSVLLVFASLHWFMQQPYSVPEPLIDRAPDLAHLGDLAVRLSVLLLTFAMLLLPILIAFIPTISLRHQSIAALLAIGEVLSLAFAMHFFHYSIGHVALPVDWSGNYVTSRGLVYVFGVKGPEPATPSIGPRIFISIAVVFALLCFFAFLLNGRRPTQSADESPRISPPDSSSIPLRSLLALLLPFTCAYIGLILPRGLRGLLFDRYLLLLLPIAVILLLRLYQDRVHRNLPLASSVLVMIFAVVAVAGTHDVYSMYRAQRSAIDELRAGGTLDTAIDGGFEYNGMIQIQHVGYINDPKMHMPAATRLTQPALFPANCQPLRVWLTPAIVPGYALSSDPSACGGLSSFAPVIYHKWLPFRTVTIYIVNTIPQAPPQKSSLTSE